MNFKFESGKYDLIEWRPPNRKQTWGYNLRSYSFPSVLQCFKSRQFILSQEKSCKGSPSQLINIKQKPMDKSDP